MPLFLEIEFRSARPTNPAFGDLRGNNQVTRQLVCSHSPPGQHLTLKGVTGLKQNSRAVELRPTLECTLAAVMEDDRIRLEHQPPSRLCHAQTPFVVFSIHVKSFVETTCVENHFAPGKYGGAD